MSRRAENPLGYEPIAPLMLKYAIPSIISGLVGAIYNIVDQFFIGRGVGMLGNAATNVAFPLVTFTIAISLLIGVGTASNFNLQLGARNEEKAKKIFGTGVSLSIIFGIIVTFLAIMLLPKLLIIFGSTDEVYPYAYEYASITTKGTLFLTGSIVFPILIRADGSPRFAMIVALAGAILNMILDPIFIFVFNMGIAGAAWATVISQAVSAIMGIYYIVVRLQSFNLSKGMFNPVQKCSRFSCALDIFKLGLSPLVNHFSIMVMTIVLNQSLNYYGGQSSYGSSIPLAVVGVISKVNVLYVAILIGISLGAQPIMGFNYGAKKYDRVKEATLINMGAVTVISVITFIVFQLFPVQIIRIFGTGTPEYEEFAIRYIRIFMFMVPLNGAQPAASFLFTAIGKPIKGLVISLSRHIIFFLPAIYILPRYFGIEGVLFTGPFADLSAAIVAFTLYMIEIRKLNSLIGDGNELISAN